jgi:hypothetical protein
MSKPFFFTSIAAVLGVVSIVANSTTAQSANLSVQQQASLKSLGIAIAVPNYIPAGYAVSKVTVEPCPTNAPRTNQGTCRFGPNYGIVYRNVQTDRCFVIEATGGGIGGVPAEYQVPVTTKLFGKVSLLFGKDSGVFKTPSKQQLASPQPGLLSDWGGNGPFYRIGGADHTRRVYYSERPEKTVSQCRNTITPNEGIQVMRSLTWLK